MNKELLPNTSLSHYRIVSKLGAGGMGEVYLAYDTKLDRKVALKVLPPDIAASHDRMDRFVREAKSAAALNHPNIAHMYEIGEGDGTHFIAMEFIEGVTLREKIYYERTELTKLLRYLQHVAEGLAKAHAAGIVHRDLKPDNIMLTRDGHPKILDFGLAKLVERHGGGEEDPTVAFTPRLPVTESASTPGVIMGTVGYMSPEQAQGKTNDIDHRSDIFSFGCILYESVTGRKAFAGKDPIDSLNKIIREPVAPVTDFRPDAPNTLQRIVRRCLAKDPEDRYQTIKDVAIELRELRRELAESAAVDITVAPTRSEAPIGSGAGPTSLESAAGSTSLSARSSSAEYVVTEIKRHKLAASVAVLAVALGAILLTAYLRRNSEVAIESIAVLPFVNQNRDTDTEYLSDGLTESIINNLAQLPALRVSPRSSVFQYKGKDTDPVKIGRDLGVRAVLTGRLLQRGDSLMVSAELLDVRDNKQIWGEQYNRKLADALDVQQQISREITDRLLLKLSGEERKQLTARDTTNAEAYQFYLKGRHYWNKRTAENLRKAMEQFQQAADKDPNYALAYVGLADCYVLLEDYTGTAADTLPKAKAFAQRALELDGSLAEAHTSIGYIYTNMWQWEEAEAEFKRAIKLSPNYSTAHHWYSLFLLDLGRTDEALAEIKRAQELDPLSRIIGTTLTYVYLAQGDLNSAIAQCKRVIDLDPNFPRAHEYLGLAYLKQGSHSEAIVELQKAVELSGGERRPFRDLGYGYAISGKRGEALAVLKELERKYEKHEAIGQDLAALYAGLGEKDQAFAWLEKDFKARSGLLAWTRWTPPFESLRNDPRFSDLLRRMGL